VQRKVTILGTLHQLQGAEKAVWKKIDDPTYEKVVKQLLIGKDFLFEEASELGPTTAERLAWTELGADHYQDVDPHRDKREALGIHQTGGWNPIEPWNPDTDKLGFEFASEHAKREGLWMGKIGERAFAKALFICGCLHTLSMSFRLLSVGYEIETFHYMPYKKLSGVVQPA
jgi:hypothetical protein